ncbi:MAG: PAS domain-containing protein, partial [Spirochaetia bacterium]|nr:PAS domain-containing protein [Spirochaetia bacterium]
LNRGEFDSAEYKRIGKGGREVWIQASYNPVLDANGKPYKVIKFASDVTAVKTKMAAEARELKARIAIMDTTSIVSEADLKGDILYINDKFCEVSQYHRDELIGKPHSFVRHPDMPKEVFKELWSTIGRGQIFRGKIKNRKKDGSPYYVDAVIAPVIGENGKPSKYIGVRYEITAEEIERQRMKGIMEAIDTSYAFIEFEVNGNIISANNNFLNLLEYRSEEVSGKHHRIFVDPIYGSSPAYTQFWENLAAGKPQNDVFKRITKSGKEVWIQAVYSPVKDEMGRITKVVKIATDVTKATVETRQREEAAELYRKEVNQIRENLEQVSKGDLTAYVSGDFKGDNELLKNAINKTLDGLNEILHSVSVAVDQVASGSSQVAASSQSLSQGATEQASSLEEITASMTELAAQTKQNAESATQGNQLSNLAKTSAENGNVLMQNMVKAMSEIDDSSQNISKIIKVIDEIAFQTNLLALNAAVEAARAGVHGKGFAVVAQEVRNLAARSAKAAKETADMIEGSIKRVSQGSDIAQKTADSLTEIVGAVSKVSSLVAEIAAASNEQAQGISQ